MASTRREMESTSWWWSGGGGGRGGGEFMFGDDEINRRREIQVEEAVGGYDLLPHAAAVAPAAMETYSQSEIDFDMYQATYPRPRLRWTQELHDQFVKAVDELGGANKATPKAILNLMGVPGLTLYHLKSHLQKFRLGKTSRRLWRREFVPAAADCCQRNDERLPPATLMEGQGSSISKAFDMNKLLNESRIKALGAERYGNLNLLVEGGVKKNRGVAEAISCVSIHHQAAGHSKMMEEEEDHQLFANAKPALLPLFPPMPECAVDRYSPEWSELLQDGGGRKWGFHHHRPMIDNYEDYMNTLGNESRRANVRFGSFFDDVASFSKVNDDNDGDLDLP
ncbi:hypothetical protein ABFS83_13G053700 [Erythranthe nasuta]